MQAAGREYNGLVLRISTLGCDPIWGIDMTKLTVDADLRAKLGNFQDLIEICDEKGRLVGFFHPVAASNQNNTGSPITDEEIEVARQQRTGRPLTDILAELDHQG